jgi:hypothetical protein
MLVGKLDAPARAPALAGEIGRLIAAAAVRDQPIEAAARFAPELTARQHRLLGERQARVGAARPASSGGRLAARLLPTSAITSRPIRSIRP